MTDRVSELKLFFSTPVWVSRVKNHQEVKKKILEYIHNDCSDYEDEHEEDYIEIRNNWKDLIQTLE